MTHRDSNTESCFYLSWLPFWAEQWLLKCFCSRLLGPEDASRCNRHVPPTRHVPPGIAPITEKDTNRSSLEYGNEHINFVPCGPCRTGKAGTDTLFLRYGKYNDNCICFTHHFWVTAKGSQIQRCPSTAVSVSCGCTSLHQLSDQQELAFQTCPAQCR